MKTEREKRLEAALRALVDEYCDYMRVNNLGDPEQQHNIKRAHEALSDEGICLGCRGGSIHHTCGREPDAVAPPQRRDALEAFERISEKAGRAILFLDGVEPGGPEEHQIKEDRKRIRRALSEPAVPSVPISFEDDVWRIANFQYTVDEPPYLRENPACVLRYVKE